MNPWRQPSIEPKTCIPTGIWPDGLSLQQRLTRLPATHTDRSLLDALEESNCLPIPNHLALHLHIPTQEPAEPSYQRWASPMIDHMKRLAKSVDDDRLIKQLNIYITASQPIHLLIDYLIHRVEAYFSVADDALLNLFLPIELGDQALEMESKAFGHVHIDYLVDHLTHLPTKIREPKTTAPITTGISLSAQGISQASSMAISDWLQPLLALNPTRISVESLHQNLGPYQNLIFAVSEPQQVLDAFYADGYHWVGTGVFAQSSCPLASAFHRGELGLGIDGYDPLPALDHLGIGLGAISRIHDYTAINENLPHAYFKTLERQHIPIAFGGHLGHIERIREAILAELICHFRLSLDNLQKRFLFCFKQQFSSEYEMLQQWVAEGLLVWKNKSFEVTDLGLSQLPMLLAPFAQPLINLPTAPNRFPHAS